MAKLTDWEIWDARSWTIVVRTEPKPFAKIHEALSAPRPCLHDGDDRAATVGKEPRAADPRRSGPPLRSRARPRQWSRRADGRCVAQAEDSGSRQAALVHFVERESVPTEGEMR